MSQLNAEGIFAKKNLGKDVVPEFEQYTKEVSTQQRAQIAYEFKHGIRDRVLSAKDSKEQVKKLLAMARKVTLSHDLKKAEVLLHKAISIEPDNFELHLQLGDTYSKDTERWAQAMKCYLEAMKLAPKRAEPYTCMATLLMRWKKDKEAIDYFDLALMFNPNNAVALSRMLHLRGMESDWSVWPKMDDYLKRFEKARGLADPFGFLPLCDDGQFQRRRSEILVNHIMKNTSKRWPAKTDRAEGQKIRVGYFSNDFYNHATMHLFGGILESHDPEKFEIYIYDYGSKLKDSEHYRARNHSDVFRDVATMPTQDLVALARADELDIAVDMKGFTEGHRMDLFCERMAPVQIAYLGYPGTTGVKAVDYMIADDITIPSSKRRHHSEKILYMPNCYQPNDENRYIARINNTREDLGLPSEGFVFSSFNNPYKVSPAEFDIWMELLKEVEGSVLWYYVSRHEGFETIQKEAEKRGVDPSRIIRAGRMAPEEHLARLQFADVFLDTFAVNAHTTASDALWAGVPVVTKMGDQFAARVAGSIVSAAGLSDLAVNTNKQYKALALKLATDPDYFADVKERISKAHEESPLYDTEGYTRDFEALLTKAFEHHQAGKKPDHLHLDK